MSGEKLVELCERLRLAARDADEMARVVVLAAERVGAAGKYAGRRVSAEHSDAIREAADLIKQLQARLAEAEGVVRPFADCVEQISPDESDEEWAKFRLLIKNYRAAARWIQETK